MTLSDFGTFHETPAARRRRARSGTYRVRLYQPGKSDFAGPFEVQAYQLEKIDLASTCKKTVYLPRRDDRGRRRRQLPVRHAVAGRPIAVALPDGRIAPAARPTRRASTTSSSRPRGSPRSRRCGSSPGCRRTTSAAVGRRDARGPRLPDRPEHHPRRLPRRRVVPAPGHDARRPGRADRPGALGRGPQAGRTRPAGSPSARSRARRVDDRREDRQGVASRSRSTTRRGAATSSGSRAPTGSATRSSPTARLTISGKKDETKLRILADRQTFKVGEEAEVNLHSRGRAGTALLTWEADRILSYRLVPLKEGDNAVAWAVDGAAVPELHAHRRADGGRTVRRGAGWTSGSSATCG